MQNQNRRGACDGEHGGGCFLSKQPLFSFSPCSLGSPSEDLKQGVNSMVERHTPVRVASLHSEINPVSSVSLGCWSPSGQENTVDRAAL